MATSQIEGYKILVGGKEVFLFSGSVHYWRLKRKKWADILKKVKDMGFHIICTYIPWSVHELERGKFDFGEYTANKDVSAFLQEVGNQGLYALVRPGPHINAEITYFGYPKRILFDPAIQARGPFGNPIILLVPPRMFPVPSYACEKFYEEVAIYFDALVPILIPYLESKIIIGVQPDNENSLFFRSSCYEQDYHPDALKLFWNFLRDKYGNIEELNQQYGKKYYDFNEVLPPRQFAPAHFSKLKPFFDWAEFKEYLIRYGILRIAKMLKDRGLKEVFYFHNTPVIYPAHPFNIPALERHIDILGFDAYPHKEEHLIIKKGACYLSGTSRFPYIPEFSSGFMALYPPIVLEDMRFTTLDVLMNGIKGMNFYMLVERERWSGSPITRNGRIRKELFEFYRWLNNFLYQTDFPSMKKEIKVCLLNNRSLDIFRSMTSILSISEFFILNNFIDWSVVVDEDDLGLDVPAQLYYQAFHDGIMKMMSYLDIPFVLSDTAVPFSKLREFKILILPSFGFVEKEFFNEVLQWVNEGGELILGPLTIKADQHFKPFYPLEYFPANPKIEKLELENTSFPFFWHLKDLSPIIKIRDHCIVGEIEFGKGRIIFISLSFPLKINNQDLAKVSELFLPLWENLSAFSTIRSLTRGMETALFRGKDQALLWTCNPDKNENIMNLQSECEIELEEITGSARYEGKNQVEIPHKPFEIKIFHLMEKS